MKAGRKGTLILFLLWGFQTSWAADCPLLSRFEEGQWRAEFTAMAGLDAGRTSREGDYYFTGSVEYDWPVYARGVLGLKAYPLFVYLQDEDEKGESDTILGGGIGVNLRLYLRKQERTGLYGEVSSGPIWHSGDLENNSSRVNFMTELAIGYELRNHWFVEAKWAHLSNAGLAADNDGVNAAGLAIGRVF